MKKIYPASALLFLFTFFFLPAKAQKNYTKGYVVTTQNDTIRGFIDDKDWSKNPDAIRFKKDLTDLQFTKYSPAQLRSFYIEPTNDYYISYIGKVDNSPILLNKLIEVYRDSDFTQKEYTEVDSVFINVLAEGNRSLYYYKDKDLKDHFFLQNTSGEIAELFFRKYVKLQPSGSKVIREMRIYRGQLQQMIGDCEKIQKDILRATYTKTALTKLINAYNECTFSPSAYKKTVEKAKIGIGVVAGMAKTTFLHSFRDTRIKYTDSYNPVVGVAFQLVLPRNHQAWSAYADILWKSFQATAVPTQQNIYERNLEVKEIKVSTLVRHRFLTRNVRPFINIGISNSFLVYSRGNILTHNDQDYKEFDKYMFGLQGGIGVDYKRYALELRYENKKSVFSGALTGTSEHNLYALFSYRLK